MVDDQSDKRRRYLASVVAERRGLLELKASRGRAPNAGPLKRFNAIVTNNLLTKQEVDQIMAAPIDSIPTIAESEAAIQHLIGAK